MKNIANEFLNLADYNLFSPFFIIALSFVIISAALLILNTKLKNKIIEIIYTSILGLLLIFIAIFYKKVILTSIDTFIEGIMKSLFFPSFAHVIFILFLVILIGIYIIKKFNQKKWFTISSIVVISILCILSLISIILISNADNIYYIYKNKASLLIMESLSFTFYMYLLYFVFVRIKFRKKKDKISKTADGIEILSF